MTHTDDIINSRNINDLLNEFAKQYKKMYKNRPCEIIIVGGASIVANYGFRSSTIDIDYFERNKYPLKDVIQSTANKLDLPNDWMNDDFTLSPSYSPKLTEVSRHYRSLNNGSIEVRTVSSEYLIAMKMKSGREAGNDVSDIIGIIKAEKELGNDIPYEKIMAAGEYLYGKEFVVEDSLSQRVSKLCTLSADELSPIYEKNVNESSQIWDEIAEIWNRGDAVRSRESAKQLGQMLRHRMEDQAKAAATSIPEDVVPVIKSLSEKYNIPEDGFSYSHEYTEAVSDVSPTGKIIISSLSYGNTVIASFEDYGTGERKCTICENAITSYIESEIEHPMPEQKQET